MQITVAGQVTNVIKTGILYLPTPLNVSKVKFTASNDLNGLKLRTAQCYKNELRIRGREEKEKFHPQSRIFKHSCRAGQSLIQWVALSCVRKRHGLYGVVVFSTLAPVLVKGAAVGIIYSLRRILCFGRVLEFYRLYD